MSLEHYFDTDSSDRKSFIVPGAKPHYNPDRPGQVEHIFLDLTLEIPQESFSGTCTITINPVRDGITNLTLDAVNLHIYTVQIEGVPQNFDYDGEYLQIHLTQPTVTGNSIKVAINYGVEKPQRGLYFILPSEHYPHKPTQVWTQGEDEDSRYWFPCFDYPGQLTTSEIRVKIPQPLMAVSNGELIHTETLESGESIFHWSQKQIHPTYLMTLAVGDFAEIQDTWRGRPVNYYVEKDRVAEGKLSMGKTPKMMEFLSQKYGYDYPFSKYAQVCVDDFIFGGMENTSTTLLTDRCLIDERAAIDNRSTESLVVHELCHQWFGDLIVIKHWSHAWVKEGMASYSEVYWTDFEYGKDDAAYYLLNEARSYLAEDSSRYRRPIVTHVYREAIELYDRHIYEKGACVYHMIRTELGDELFWKAINIFLHDHAHQTVETIDLIRAIEKASGKNLMFLFDQYVFRGGHPDYKVAYSWDNDSKLAKVTVIQTQGKSDKTVTENGLFDLKIPIGLGYLAGEIKTFTVRIYEKEQNFYFPLEKKPDFISFDQGNNYLKTVTLEYALPELKAQLLHDPDPISRIYAAQALAKKGGLEAVKALESALKNDKFWAVRSEVAQELAKIKLDQVSAILIAGLQDPEARVRRSLVDALGKVKDLPSLAAIKQIVMNGDASYYVESAAARVLGSMVSATLKDHEAGVIQLLNQVLQERSGWNEMVRSGAIFGLAQLKTSSVALESIIPYTKLGIPQPLRLSAIRALGIVSKGQEPPQVELVLSLLGDLAKETFFLTQLAVVASLGQMETPPAIGILQALATQTPDGRVRRVAEEAIGQVQGNIGSDKAVKQLREELDEMKKENQQLRSRLENLEAKSTKSLD